MISRMFPSGSSERSAASMRFSRADPDAFLRAAMVVPSSAGHGLRTKRLPRVHRHNHDPLGLDVIRNQGVGASERRMRNHRVTLAGTWDLPLLVQGVDEP